MSEGGGTIMRSVKAVVAAALVPLIAGGCGTGPGGTRHAPPAQCPPVRWSCSLAPPWCR